MALVGEGGGGALVLFTRDRLEPQAPPCEEALEEGLLAREARQLDQRARLDVDAPEGGGEEVGQPA